MYITAAADLAPQLPVTTNGVIFFGHTHKQGGFVATEGDEIDTIPAVAKLYLKPDCRYWINPGSVGQPRDGDPRAAYLIYDSTNRTVELRRTCYDIAAAQSRIRAAGLPEKMARRLDLGL